jgi:quercetin dioxygenase-like cupin family protein
MALMVRGDEIPEHPPIARQHLRAGEASSRQIYGVESSLSVTARSGGYHSRPHICTSEQLSYVVEGELWVFIDGDGYRLRKGDYLRIPRDVLRWEWNREQTASVIIELHTPPLIASRAVRQKSVGLFDEGEHAVPRSIGQRIFMPDETSSAVESKAVHGSGESRTALLIRADQVPSDREIGRGGTAIAHEFVYGKECDLQLSTWPSEFLSNPHVHECEQLNYVHSGAVSVFIEDKEYRLTKGDFLRVPTMAVHWGSTRTHDVSEMFGAHAPCLDPVRRRGSVPLFAGNETPSIRGWAHSISVSPEYTRLEAARE